MAYYDLYHNAPGWGTSGYHFSTPPMPSYQPQPTWRGQDYFRAHGGFNDPSMYDYANNRIRDHPGAGVGLEEARLWHRRAYGGMYEGGLHQMLPSDIGSAAAYEVWRNWKAHYGVYAQPLAGDRMRQQEALVGLAVGEASRLWQLTARASDSYGLLEASETAARTAKRIFQQSMSFGDEYDEYDPYSGYGRLSRRNSAVSLRSMSRGRSMSRSGTPFDSGMYGTAGSMYDTGSVYGGTGSVYGGTGSVYGGTGSAYGDNLDPSYDGALMRRRSYSALGGGYAATTPVAVPASMTPSLSYAQQPMSYPGSSYGGYPATSPGYVNSNYGYASTPSVTVVQTPSSSRHRSHSRHRSSRSGRHRHRHGSHSNSYYVASAVPYGY